MNKKECYRIYSEIYKKEYYEILMRQFYQTMNLNYKVILKECGDKVFYEGIVDWLKERQLMGKKYVEFLKSYGKEINNYATAEVDKGVYDSIIDVRDGNVITPYFYPPQNNNVYNYEFCPETENPGMFKINKSGKLEEVLSVPKYINQFITENPYDRTNLCGFEDLHNGGNFDIIVGMYGNIHDKDKDYKLQQLNWLRDRLFDEKVRVELERDKDFYFAFVMSDRENKKLNYCKTK